VKVRLAIDRFEGDRKQIAVLLAEDGTAINFPKTLLPSGAGAAARALAHGATRGQPPRSGGSQPKGWRASWSERPRTSICVGSLVPRPRAAAMAR
jgi:hypothetical protein